MSSSYIISVRLEGFDKNDLQQIVGSFEYGFPPWTIEDIKVEPYEDVLLLEGELRVDSWEKPEDMILDFSVSLWWGNNGFAPLEITIRPLVRGGEAKTYLVGVEDFRKLRSQVAIATSRVESEQNK